VLRFGGRGRRGECDGSPYFGGHNLDFLTSVQSLSRTVASCRGSFTASTQLIELAGEQGEGESKDRAGHLDSLTDSNDARPVRGRRPRRSDRGTGKVS
jgi:hypothetical protein